MEETISNILKNFKNIHISSNDTYYIMKIYLRTENGWMLKVERLDEESFDTEHPYYTIKEESVEESVVAYNIKNALSNGNCYISFQ